MAILWCISAGSATTQHDANYFLTAQSTGFRNPFMRCTSPFFQRPSKDQQLPKALRATLSNSALQHNQPTGTALAPWRYTSRCNASCRRESSLPLLLLLPQRGSPLSSLPKETLVNCFSSFSPFFLLWALTLQSMMRRIPWVQITCLVFFSCFF